MVWKVNRSLLQFIVKTCQIRNISTKIWHGFPIWGPLTSSLVGHVPFRVKVYSKLGQYEWFYSRKGVLTGDQIGLGNNPEEPNWSYFFTSGISTVNFLASQLQVGFETLHGGRVQSGEVCCSTTCKPPLSNGGSDSSTFHTDRNIELSNHRFFSEPPLLKRYPHTVSPQASPDHKCGFILH